MPNYRYTLSVSLVFFVSVHCNPIVIRSGVVSQQGQEQNANQYEGAHAKGIANFEGDQGFNKQNENKLVYSNDMGRYGETAGNQKNHVNEGKFDKGSFYQNGGGEVGDHEAKTGHKKGHHKSGFHNSYHKDESGSNSSFFDDGSDEGDNYVHKTHKGAYGDTAQDSRRGSELDAAHAGNQNARNGQFETAGRYGQDHANNNNYNRNRFLNDRENANRRGGANSYGEAGRHEEYHDRPHAPPYQQPVPYDNYGPSYRESIPYNNRPFVPKKHITIYEDPRYVGRQGAPYRQYDDDYIELDVRPIRDGMRNMDRRPPYDYYY